MLKNEFSVQSQVRQTEVLTANVKGKHIPQSLVMMVKMQTTTASNFDRGHPVVLLQY